MNNRIEEKQKASKQQSSMESVISIKDVSMKFNLGEEKVDNIKEYIIKFLKRELFYKEFLALEHIDLEIKKGEVLGIVGYNGSGKSTLLKIIAGVMKPSTGEVRVNGSMAPLIELGAGFDPDLSGRENIFLNGAVLGYRREFMESKLEDIIAFSELGNFINVPIKNYSSGMKARLGFSIATVLEPEILIVDEVLSVGDYKFQEKCQNKIKEMMRLGITILFVSHSIKQVAEICDRVVWLHKGKVRQIGEASEVCESFLADR